MVAGGKKIRQRRKVWSDRREDGNTDGEEEEERNETKKQII